MVFLGWFFVKVTENISAVPVVCPANGHYYECIDNGSSISWDAANQIAQSKSFMGKHGHLATITSAQENDFITTNIVNGGPEIWIGLYQDASSPSYSEPSGGWTKTLTVKKRSVALSHQKPIYAAQNADGYERVI
jgi:hypothetical protein